MNELLETERAYVEELLCVLQVFVCSTEKFIICFFSWACVSCLCSLVCVSGICVWDGQSSHVSPHPCSSAEQKGDSVWQHAWNLPLSQEVSERHLAVVEDACAVASHFVETVFQSISIFNSFSYCFQDVLEGAGAVHRLPGACWAVFSREGEWSMRLPAPRVWIQQKRC